MDSHHHICITVSDIAGGECRFRVLFISFSSIIYTLASISIADRGVLIMPLQETQVGLASNEAGAQAERERRESEWGIQDLDQEEEE